MEEEIDEIKIKLPDCIKEYQKYYDNPSEINSMVFLRLIQYYHVKSRTSELFDRKRNLIKMVQSLQLNIKK